MICLKCSSQCNTDCKLELSVKDHPIKLKHYLCPTCTDRWITAMFEIKKDCTYIEKELVKE